jgi:hypothetical protein
VIGAKRVTAPDGTTWKVGRRWLPDKPTLWRRRKRKRDDGSPAEHGNGSDFFPDFGIDEAFVFVLAILAVVVVFVLLTTVVFPILVLTLELLIVLVLLAGVLAGRFLFRKPWTIRARAKDGRELSWRASGWRRSGRVRDDAAAALALGHTDVRPAEALEPART